MHSFARGINTRWKNSKQARWKGAFRGFYLHFLICVRTHRHACHLYRISGSIHVWFGNSKQTREKHETFKCVFHSSAAEPQSQWQIFKTAFWHDIKHWNVNIDRRWEQRSWKSDLNLLFFSAFLLFQPSGDVLSRNGLYSLLAKMSFPKGLSGLSCQCRQEIVRLISEIVWCVFGGFAQSDGVNICVYLTGR